MADQLAKPEDLASLLKLDYEALSAAEKATMALLVEMATAVVQSAAGGQRIVAATSTAVLPAPFGRYLDLPQWPVRAIIEVKIDGVVDTLWRPQTGRLWRLSWRPRYGYPSEIAVTYDHGYPADSQDLQLGRKSVLSLAAPVCSNPGGAVRTQIDDYAEAYEAMAARMEASPFLKEALAAQYGRTAGSVSIGG